MRLRDYANQVIRKYAPAAVLTAALVAGVGAVPAFAQTGHGHGYDPYAHGGTGQMDRRDVLRLAAVNGYHEGFEHGVEDRSRGAGFDFEHDAAYQQASTGFDGRWGWELRDEYQQIFREAYEKAYSDGYYRRAHNDNFADEFDFGRYEIGYGDNGHSARQPSRAEVVRLAQVNGYNRGFESGIVDRTNRAGFNYTWEPEYRRATAGFQGSWGMMREYQTSFRQAFARGYQDAYSARAYNRSYGWSTVDRYDPYYGYPGYRTSPSRIDMRFLAQRAAQQGYRDGFVRGQYDQNIGVRRPNPTGHGAYEHALNGWNPEWGGASAFKQYYRQYFLEGYQDAYYNRSNRSTTIRPF